MFEEYEEEYILDRMLEAVEAKYPEIDTREGSIIYDALAPAAFEMAQMYVALDDVLNESYVDTASYEGLVMRCAEKGIEAKEATKAIIKGAFDEELELGDRFALLDTDINYVVTEYITQEIVAKEDVADILNGAVEYSVYESAEECPSACKVLYYYKLECEDAGTDGNAVPNILIPIDSINGLSISRMLKVLIPGEIEEDEYNLRMRYYESIDSTAFGGNIADYKEKVLENEKIGGCKVYPAHAGGGTVKLVVIPKDLSLFDRYDDTIEYVYWLVSELDNISFEVKDTFDPKEYSGEGRGLAPIGHKVSVESVQVFPLGVEMGVETIDNEMYGVDAVQESIKKVINTYLMELAETWKDEDNLIVRVSQIESKVLDLPLIKDISSTKINGVPKNIVLDKDEIAVLSGVNIYV